MFFVGMMAKSLVSKEERVALAKQLREAAELLEKDDVGKALGVFSKAVIFIVDRTKSKFPVNNDKVIDFIRGLAK